jgi:hypothetical protein
MLPSLMSRPINCEIPKEILRESRKCTRDVGSEPQALNEMESCYREGREERKKID